MLLLVAATEMEMKPVRQRFKDVFGISFLVCGVGPVEAAVKITKYLAGRADAVRIVVNFGVGGAYPETGLQPLDLCLAKKEVLGDFGICYDAAIESFGDAFPVEQDFPLTGEAFNAVAAALDKRTILYKSGTFVTVNCTSATAQRGLMLRDQYQAMCENMEGAAVARVCQEYDLPCIELRCISNMVVDRDRSQWKLNEAITKCADAVASLLPDL